ncbi:MAG: caspase family protein [Archaeoglobaceae archaeon]
MIMKKALAIFMIAALFLLVATAMAVAKPEKPIPATDVELVKKVTLKGPKGQGKPATSATGVPIPLGEGKNKYAIVIGISDYPGTENDLNFADDDAIDMYNALVNKYGFLEENVHLLINSNANYSAIESAVNAVKQEAKEGDEVVFFFSGHGARGRANDGDKEAIDEAIVSHDGKNLVYIWDGELRDWFRDFKTTRIVFIFDSCLAGGMTDLKADGRIIVMATTENGVAYEFSDLENGQFTYYFVDEGMLQGMADTTPNDGNVTVEEAFDYAKANCIYQSPTISDSFTNDLLL